MTPSNVGCMWEAVSKTARLRWCLKRIHQDTANSTIPSLIGREGGVIVPILFVMIRSKLWIRRRLRSKSEMNESLIVLATTTITPQDSSQHTSGVNSGDGDSIGWGSIILVFAMTIVSIITILGNLVVLLSYCKYSHDYWSGWFSFLSLIGLAQNMWSGNYPLCKKYVCLLAEIRCQTLWATPIYLNCMPT